MDPECQVTECVKKGGANSHMQDIKALSLGKYD